VSFRRLAASALALVAIAAFAGRELPSHRHAFSETDLASHPVAELESPHSPSADLPLHLEAGHEAEHQACADCLLQALAPQFAAAIAAIGQAHERAAPVPRAPIAAPSGCTDESATPRGPPSAA
jgi:hypothetical protein